MRLRPLDVIFPCGMAVEEVSPRVFLLEAPSPLDEMPTTSSYLIQGEGGLVLIDPGYPSQATEELLKEVLAPYGTTPITVLLTHGHVDHYGAAGFLQRSYGARILVQDRDRQKVILGAVQELEAQRQHVQRHWRLMGLGEEIDEIWEDLDVFRSLYTGAMEAEPLPEGELELYGLRFRVIPTPGHTSGSCSFYEEARKVLFSGDTLLPLEMETWLSGLAFGERGAGLEDYLKGLGRLEGLEVNEVLPGHGPPFYDLRGRIREVILRYRRHGAELLDLLSRASTAAQLARQLYPDVRGFKGLLLTGEVFGLLEQLRKQGKVTATAVDGTLWWRR